MNRLTLALNVAILVVTFVVALTAGDVQSRMLSSAVQIAGRDQRCRRVSDGFGPVLLRVVQSMDNFYPATAHNALTGDQLEAIRDAIVAYRSAIRSGVDGVLARSDDGGDLRQALAQVGRIGRADLEAFLSRAFNNSTTVRRVATEIIRNCR